MPPTKRPRTANISLAQFAAPETRAEMGQPVDPAPKSSTDDTLRKVLAVGIPSTSHNYILIYFQTTSGNIPIPLTDRSFDPIVLDDWEDQIIYDRDTQVLSHLPILISHKSFSLPTVSLNHWRPAHTQQPLSTPSSPLPDPSTTGTTLSSGLAHLNSSLRLSPLTTRSHLHCPFPSLRKMPTIPRLAAQKLNQRNGYERTDLLLVL